MSNIKTSQHPLLNRRAFTSLIASGLGAAACPSVFSADDNSKRPNVVLIMTDDQGYGDIGVHGNDKIHTPHMDALSKQSAVMTQFYVCPVCAPTRASLMTGRYNYRTGAIDTYLGRAMMHGEETTIAEMLSAAGYKTGIFGKWHLGDNVPMRPDDQGFDEYLIHMGGGLAQPANPPGSKYDDPELLHNGRFKTFKGYCTDIFTDAAIDFIENNKDQPFFTYLATNAPHTPLQIDEKYVKPYRDMGLDDTTAKVYGMVENIDDNLGKLLAALKRLNLEENTIVIFLTDNGPKQKRYTAGLRGRKGQVYEGGIRVPFFIRWPNKLKPGNNSDRIAAHIDVAPTILDACGIKKPDNVALDGRSLMPLLTQDSPKWDDRNLFFQWHRGDVPERFRDCAVRSQKYKLINGVELYDIQNDPYEKTDIADDNPKMVAQMRDEYLEWFRDVSGERGYAPPRIHIGSPKENPTILTPQDWRGPDAGWGKDSIGYWEVEILKTAKYDIRLRFHPLQSDAVGYFKLRNVILKQELRKGDEECTLQTVNLPAGSARLEAWINQGDKNTGMQYVDVKLID